MELVAEIEPLQQVLDLVAPVAHDANEAIVLGDSARVRLAVDEMLEHGLERGDACVHLDRVEALDVEHACERPPREVDEVIPAVERRRPLVQHPTGERVDVRDDDEDSSSRLQQVRDLGKHSPRLVDVLEHGVQRHHVEAPPVEPQLVERSGAHVETEALSCDLPRTPAELVADGVPAAVQREPQEQADRGADVEQPAGAPVGLELVKDLFELLAVELELPVRQEHVHPKVIRARPVGPVLLEDQRLVDLRVREDERTLVAAHDRVAALDEQDGVPWTLAERAGDSSGESRAHHSGLRIEQFFELALLRREVAVSTCLFVEAGQGRMQTSA